MKEQLVNQLRSEFPELKLPWMECGDGWYDMLHDLFGALGKLIKNEKDHHAADEDSFQILQVKEKHGSLRVYMSTATDDMHDLIDIAEKQSRITCEGCGKLGRMIKDLGWLKVRCEECEVNDRRRHKDKV